MVQANKVTRILSGPLPVTLVQDIDMSVGTGEFIAIVGPSGSGKSSLLYLLGLLDVPTEGTILLDGHDTGALDNKALAGLRLTKLGFVFQFHFLLPEFTTIDNVLVPMRKLGRLEPRPMRERAQGLLDELGVGEAAHLRPGQLSGGMRQRVAVARALANDPLIILADEPTGNLDQKNGHIVFDIFERLVGEMGKTVIAVTHDDHLAGRTQRQIHLIDGRIEKDG